MCPNSWNQLLLPFSIQITSEKDSLKIQPATFALNCFEKRQYRIFAFVIAAGGNCRKDCASDR